MSNWSLFWKLRIIKIYAKSNYDKFYLKMKQNEKFVNRFCNVKMHYLFEKYILFNELLIIGLAVKNLFCLSHHDNPTLYKKSDCWCPRVNPNFRTEILLLDPVWEIFVKSLVLVKNLTGSENNVLNFANITLIMRVSLMNLAELLVNSSIRQ